MKNRIPAAFTAVLIAANLMLRQLFSVSYAESGYQDYPKGWLLWHSYSDYSALDSRLYLRSPDGSIQEIGGDFIHAMNGSFGCSPEQITFMAIDRSADEWDIYLSVRGCITNLTQSSGFRNEDPKFSPDGKSIVFKRGYWDGAANDFVYDLALLDLDTMEVALLTNDSTEEAMPCFSEDGRFIWYAAYEDGYGSICRMDAVTHKSETIYKESGVTAYYPVAYGDHVYFTKWYSAENRCDQIMCFDGEAVSRLPFNSEEYDCSDACPVGDTGLIYSSTAGGGYDLCYFDGTDSFRLDALNTGNSDLGAAFFPAVRGDADLDGTVGCSDAVLLQKWLLTVPDTVLPDPEAADCNADGRLDALDLSLMKRSLIISCAA